MQNVAVVGVDACVVKMAKMETCIVVFITQSRCCTMFLVPVHFKLVLHGYMAFISREGKDTEISWCIGQLVVHYFIASEIFGCWSVLLWWISDYQ